MARESIGTIREIRKQCETLGILAPAADKAGESTLFRIPVDNTQ